MKKFVGFLLPAVLVLSGSVGMVVSGFAWAPLSDVAYEQTQTYRTVYQQAGQFQYSNAAVDGLSEALNKQLKGWQTWKNAAYAIYQAKGEVKGVYLGQDSELLGKDSLSKYEGSYNKNVFDTLVTAVNRTDGSPELKEKCGNIATKGDYSYSAFSGMVQCVKDNGGTEPTSFLSVYYKGLLFDAAFLLQHSEAILRYSWRLFWYEDASQFETMSMDEIINKLENSIYASVYGNGNDGVMLDCLYSLQFAYHGDVDAVRDMDEYHRKDFARVYSSAELINPDFELDLQQYIEKPSTGDDKPGGNNPGGETGDDNTGGADEPTTKPDDVRPGNTQQTLSSNAAINKVAAPNTGSLAKFKGVSTNNTMFVLSTIATLAGIIGMISLVKSYMFSPLKKNN